MEVFWKAAVVTILAIILGATLGKNQKDISVVLTVVAGCLVVMVALQYLSEVIEFLWELGDASKLNHSFMGTLLKMSGVALMTEFTGTISSDSGNSSLAKAIQILGTSAILFLSVPLFEGFFSLIQEIMRSL